MGHYPEVYVLIVMVPELVCVFAKHKAGQKWFLVGYLEAFLQDLGVLGATLGLKLRLGPRKRERLAGQAPAALEKSFRPTEISKIKQLH